VGGSKNVSYFRVSLGRSTCSAATRMSCEWHDGPTRNLRIPRMAVRRFREEKLRLLHMQGPRAGRKIALVAMSVCILVPVMCKTPLRRAAPPRLSQTGFIQRSLAVDLTAVTCLRIVFLSVVAHQKALCLVPRMQKEAPEQKHFL